MLLLLLLAANPGASGAEAIRIGIFLQGSETADSIVVDSAKAEVERLLARPGTEIVWRKDSSGMEAFHRVLVVRLRGNCSASRLDRWPEPAALGSTKITSGKVQPFIDISCDHVTAAASRMWRWPGGRIAPEVYGRALARVAAHEIFHALTESADHDEDGLMKPAFDRLDLCSRKLELLPSSLARLDRALGIAFRPGD